MLTLAFQPASPADESFLLDLYSQGRAGEMALVPWTGEQKAAFLCAQFQAQRSHYETHYPQSAHLIIRQGEEPVGRLWVDRAADRIHVLDLAVHPLHQCNGIGSTVLRSLMAEAAAAGLPLTIYVESFNPARRLFQRLGFADQSETGLHVLMAWRQSPVPVPEPDSL